MPKTPEQKEAEAKAKAEAKAAKAEAKAAKAEVKIDEPGVEAQTAKVANEFPSSVSVKTGKHGATEFQLVVVGEEARVYGKNGLPVSPVLSIREASRLASAFNTRDPEQIEAKSRPKDVKKNILAERAAEEA